MLELVLIEEYDNGEIIFNKHDDQHFAYMVLFGQVFLHDKPEAPTEAELSLENKATIPTMKKIEAGELIDN